MSWLSSIGNAIGGVAKKGLNVVKSIATPVASLAVGLVPGVGPLLSKGVDILGNKLLGDSGDKSSAAGNASATPVSDLLAQLNGTTSTQLGTSPAVSALAASTTASNFLGIGGSAPGIFGIGDGKAGVFGIGTGKHAARKQAEDAAKGEGLSAKQVKAAGEQAAAAAGNKVGGSGEASLSPLLIGAGILLALLAL